MRIKSVARLIPYESVFEDMDVKRKKRKKLSFFIILFYYPDSVLSASHIHCQEFLRPSIEISSDSRKFP